MVAQQRECASCHRAVHVTWVKMINFVSLCFPIIFKKLLSSDSWLVSCSWNLDGSASGLLFSLSGFSLSERIHFHDWNDQ